MVARRTHDPKVAGSSPVSATRSKEGYSQEKTSKSNGECWQLGKTVLGVMVSDGVSADVSLV